jgi:hypothetical protein
MAEEDMEYAISYIHEGFKGALRHFAKWFSGSWKYGGKEQWERTYAEPYPGDEYIKGYNDGVEAIHVAMDCFLDEHF